MTLHFVERSHDGSAKRTGCLQVKCCPRSAVLDACIPPGEQGVREGDQLVVSDEEDSEVSSVHAASPACRDECGGPIGKALPVAVWFAGLSSKDR